MLKDDVSIFKDRATLKANRACEIYPTKLKAKFRITSPMINWHQSPSNIWQIMACVLVSHVIKSQDLVPYLVGHNRRKDSSTLSFCLARAISILVNKPNLASGHACEEATSWFWPKSNQLAANSYTYLGLFFQFQSETGTAAATMMMVIVFVIAHEGSLITRDTISNNISNPPFEPQSESAISTSNRDHLRLTPSSNPIPPLTPSPSVYLMPLCEPRLKWC